MPQVTGGEFSYKRTVKTGDYENKTFEARITFSVGDGESAVEIVQQVSTRVVEITHARLGLAAPVASDPPALTGGKAAIAESEGTAPKKKGPKTTAKADAVVVEIPAKPAADPAAVEVVAEPAKPAVVEVAVDPAAVEDDLLTASEAPKDITDKEVSDAAAKKNAQIKNPQAIRSLVAKYVTFPKGTKDMTQEQRRAFLKELDALTSQQLAA